jgi:hypothetical protein
VKDKRTGKMNGLEFLIGWHDYPLHMIRESL